ncbi:MAG TPA: hypothetical protein VNQ79_11220 [Blastocatellia bacterium]|nr:hypothetical protein [Blastocatellia bacterium]
MKKEENQPLARPFSRRRFLESGTLATLTAGALLCLTGSARAQQSRERGTAQSGAKRTTANSRTVQNFDFTRSSFAPYLGQSFRVVSAAVSPVYLTLAEINDLPAPHKSATAAAERDEAIEKDLSFVLVFRGFSHEPLSQQTLVLEHSSLGRLALLLVPVGGNEAWCYYEAVFNRSVR